MMAPASLAALIAAPFVGSFVGLVADRLPRGESVALGRSACRACHAPLAPRDLVPVLSWLVLRGRCRRCGAAIGGAALLAELGALAVAVSAVVTLPEALILPSCALGWALLALALIDRAHLLLPDAITLPLLALGLVVEAWWQQALPLDFIIGAVSGGTALALVALAYRRLRGRDGLGQGDIKLFAAGGAWVGWMGLPSVLLLAALCGIVMALLAQQGARDLAQRKHPFGPALALAIWFVWLLGPVGLA